MRRPGLRRDLAVAVALLVRATAADAAAYAPGLPDAGGADPARAADGAGAGHGATNGNGGGGNGIRWTLAPVHLAGSVSLDVRALKLEDGRRTNQTLVYNDIEFASHVWEPWFIQLRGGLGALAAHDVSRDAGSRFAATSNSTALTGRFAMSVFPISRFPFELQAEVSDSRVSGDTLGTDYRLHRVTLNQAWRPEFGNDSYNVNFEHSRLRTSDGAEDTVDSLRGSALRQFSDHTFELGAHLSVNERSDTDDRSRLATLSARHGFQPAGSLHVDTLATWNQIQLRSGAGGTAQRFGSDTDIRQISSFGTWRPRDGEPLFSAASPFYLTGSVRLLDANTEAGSGALLQSQRLRAVNASLGASQELTREWRLAGGLSATQIAPEGGRRSSVNTANAAVTYTPEGLTLGAWSYTPSLGGNVGVSRSSEVGERRTWGGQLAQGVSRTWLAGQTDSLSLNLTQSLGALHDSQSQRWSRALAHSAGLFWQGSNDTGSQSYAGLSVSDSRSLSQERGEFQLVNLQVSRRTELTRHTSWSGNLTAQASRSDNTQLDPFSGLLRESGPGWQRFYSGTLSYENQRLWAVPRLRYTVLLSVNSQQLETRAAGDIDALRERVTESLENRLDYAIGRLELRLSARVARVEGRGVGLIYARAQRRY
ncbi:hypothetical protein Lcho_4132 [Leptothrix cholodnii SP-6]|uniref:PEP-CTERM system associated protein n=1 Tax=Leptothrix cholodnii (strain ATCC 51168 / LMG 8142 / SP-6) TaxID=395495 RepID=B1XXR5_LEPCP|nr:hypothetical protein [Leptothrix cholodnii]ACB36384.1 hypothetical protein Lcho_4132 [Leptothrix cholodnii SP-6]